MANPTEPMIKLQPNGVAPILSYNVPEPTSYSGRNFIELKFDEGEDHDKFFKEKYRAITPITPVVDRVANIDAQTIKSTVIAAMKGGFTDPNIFSNAKSTSSSLFLAKKMDASSDSLEIKSNIPISYRLASIEADEITQNIQAGMKLHLYKNMHGTLECKYIPAKPPHQIKPHLYLVEVYQLTTRLGDYGAGRVIKTFSLLPGEKTKISIKSYLKKQTDAKDSSSILDSFTDESSNDFESSVQEEHSDKKNFAKTREYYAEAEASASWGWGDASVKGGFKDSSNSAREEFGKNLSNAVEKHATKASSKRDVQINTSYEVKEDSGEETSIEREIQNINLSRTLNFVFRQMNQEYVSILHLVDVKLAFFNGLPESRKEVSLSGMDTLLTEVLIPEKVSEVKKYIVNQLKQVRDINGTPNELIELVETTIDTKIEQYYRVKKITQTYDKESDATPLKIKVKGIITSAITSVMRTEGIIVESILGEGLALDSYATQLQDLEVQIKEQEKEKLKAEVEQLRIINAAAKTSPELAIEIVKNKNKHCCDNSLRIRMEETKDA